MTVRYALRSLRRQALVSTLVVITIGLGVGTATAVYSLVDALLLRPFPYPDPDRLVRMQCSQTEGANETMGASLPDLEDWRREQRTLTALAAYGQFDNNLTDGGVTQSIKMTFTTPELFALLGADPILGRTFTQDEDREGGDVRQLVLGYELWRSHFGGDRNVLGRTVRLRGDAYTVIGVMPAGFRYPDRSDVWAPLMARYASYTFPFWRARGARMHEVIGRLAPGVSVAQARADFERIAASLAETFPDTNGTITAGAITLREAESGKLRPYLLLMMGASLCVLLIAVVNVASLLLARAAAREHDVAVHSALGAGRGQIALRMLTECLLLASAGGILGTALALAAIPRIPRFLPDHLPAWIRFEPDPGVLLFAVVISLLCGALFSLAPVMRLARADLHPRLKDGARGSASAGVRALSTLVAVEVGFALLLLVLAGLLLRSFDQLQRIDAGLDTAGILAVRTSRFISGKSQAELAPIYSSDHRGFESRFAELPGVTAVGGSYFVPLGDGRAQRQTALLSVRGQDQKDLSRQLPAIAVLVTPSFFETLGIPLLDGRFFTEAEGPATPSVVIVSKTAAETLWPGRNPIGQQVRWGTEAEGGGWSTVAGVVGDTRWSAFETGQNLEIYFCARQFGTLAITFFLRTNGNPAALIPEVRRIVAELSPETAVVYARPYQDIIEESTWQPRVWSIVLSAFAMLAAALAAIGLYGVLNYLVAQRTQEIGIRLALGAQSGAIVLLVLRQGMLWAGAGGAAGLALAIAGGRLVQPLLHGVGPLDLPTYVTVVAGILGVCFVACLLPAWRASRVDPNVALRRE
ncbi:MAG: ABC transporter permease [Bryobacterales bacterium]|nr:ABC transporter permease [Bryobacterales bacterium]